MELVKDIDAYAWQFVNADGYLCISNDRNKIPEHHSSLKKLIHLNDEMVVGTDSEWQGRRKAVEAAIANNKGNDYLAKELKPVPMEAIGMILDDVMAEAVGRGADSRSMPDAYVAVAAFLAFPDEYTLGHPTIKPNTSQLARQPNEQKGSEATNE